MELSLAAQRRRIRRWSVVAYALLAVALGVYVYGRTHRVAYVVGADGHRHASGAAIAVRWLALLGVVALVVAAELRRRSLTRRYNAQILASDPLLRGEDIPLVD